MSWFQLVPVFCAIINFFVQASTFRDYLASKQNVITEDDNYRLSGNELKALYPRLNGTATANAWVYHTQPLKTIEFKYNSSGLRVQKKVTANGKTEVTDYTLHGKLVTHMTVGNDNLHFFYDAQSRPTKVNFNGVTYTYLHNLQGDVVGIIDKAGNLVVEYKYDAWGRSISITGSLADTLGKRNPFRYRGYVYDEEAKFFYLRSRYYNPAVGRFVNADARLDSRGFGANLFGYCAGNPVVRADDGGFAWYNDVLNAIGNAASDAWDWTTNAATDAWSWTTNAATDAWNWTEQAATDAWNWTKRAAIDAWTWTKRAATDAWNWMKQATKTVAGLGKSAFQWAKKFIADRFSTPEKARNTLNGLGLGCEAIALLSASKAPKVAAGAMVVGLILHGAAWIIEICNEGK